MIHLRPLQRKVLEALSQARGGLNRTKLYDLLEFKNYSGLNDTLGRNDPEKRAAIDKDRYPSLLSLGLIKLTPLDIDGVIENVYSITPTGREALAQVPPAPEWKDPVAKKSKEIQEPSIQQPVLPFDQAISFD